MSMLDSAVSMLDSAVSMLDEEEEEGGGLS